MYGAYERSAEVYDALLEVAGGTGAYLERFAHDSERLMERGLYVAAKQP